MSLEEFKFLSSLRERFLRRRRGRFEGKRKRSAFVVKRQPPGCARSDDLYQPNGKGYRCYEPTDIGFTRYSLLWGWSRVREYYRELQDMDGDKREELRMVHELMYS